MASIRSMPTDMAINTKPFWRFRITSAIGRMRLKCYDAKFSGVNRLGDGSRIAGPAHQDSARHGQDDRHPLRQGQAPFERLLMEAQKLNTEPRNGTEHQVQADDASWRMLLRA